MSETVRLAAAAGIVGGSIEDYGTLTRPREQVYALELATDRVARRGRGGSRSTLPFHIHREIGEHLVGRQDLADTIGRFQAYQEAGADVLYAPGLTSRDAIAASSARSTGR